MVKNLKTLKCSLVSVPEPLSSKVETIEDVVMMVLSVDLDVALQSVCSESVYTVELQFIGAHQRHWSNSKPFLEMMQLSHWLGLRHTMSIQLTRFRHDTVEKGAK